MHPDIMTRIVLFLHIAILFNFCYGEGYGINRSMTRKYPVRRAINLLTHYRGSQSYSNPAYRTSSLTGYGNKYIGKGFATPVGFAPRYGGGFNSRSYGVGMPNRKYGAGYGKLFGGNVYGYGGSKSIKGLNFHRSTKIYRGYGKTYTG
ncbi:peroxisomal membrane protein PEX13-like [Mytilus trossulus]|uniref:peroxisomal membrane protein PEX13-like n=1 Tax=Mytilus trossulus TaxID=6551 RepID=UPI0030067BEA